MKKFILSGTVLLFILALSFLFFPAELMGQEPEPAAFGLTVHFPTMPVPVGEQIPVEAVFLNRTMRSYIASHGQNLISVSYTGQGLKKEKIRQKSSCKSYVLPGQSVSDKTFLTITEPGKYTVYVDAYLEIGEMDYHYNKSYGITVQ